MKKRIVSLLLSLTLAVSMTACGNPQIEKESETVSEELNSDSIAKGVEIEIEGASYITLSDEAITIDGKKATSNEQKTVYVANDIVYYEDGKDFTYGEGEEKDAHSKEEADKHTVVHITKPGTYVLSGKLSAGQIAVDLGDDAKDDEEAVVTLVLNGVDITCSVAPGVIFYNVYECSSSKEKDAVKDVDTSAAGANVLITDGSKNHVTGSYVAKIYESVELNEEGTEVVDSKKLHKYDAAFYSKMSMNINGGEQNSGVLNINAQNEGMGSELHLTINGGQINIVSGNDGINTNEDNVSVTTINDGWLSIRVDGSTGEGDGIDSNGWLVINGGVVNTAACSTSMDAGIDSDKGIHINGGTVIAGGNMLDHISDSEQDYVVFTFQNKVKADEKITLKKGEEELFFTLGNDYTYLIVSSEFVAEGETYTLWKGEEQLSVVAMNGKAGGPGMMKPDGQMPEEFAPGQIPEDFEKGERPEIPEGMEPGERPEIPEGMEPGERPGMPEGMEPGERPGMPEGMEPGERPEMLDGGRGGKGDFEQMNLEDAVTEFEIKAGENMFMVVAN